MSAIAREFIDAAVAHVEFFYPVGKRCATMLLLHFVKCNQVHFDKSVYCENDIIAALREEIDLQSLTIDRNAM